MKTGVTKSRPTLTVGAARKAIRTVIAKRGPKPMSALAWFRSLSAERQAALRKRFLGRFGPPARGTKKTAAKHQSASRKTTKSAGARSR